MNSPPAPENPQLQALANNLAGKQSLVVITGAGISAESGITTFRGIDGYWARFNPQELASPEGFARDPALVWRWYDERRRQILTAQTNPGHHAIAELEKLFPEFLLITQNVDGLHAQAGSQQFIEIHGSIWRVRCMRSGQEWENRDVYDQFPVKCRCGSLLRPAVLWFGESYQPSLILRAQKTVNSADVILVVGTSGQVWIVSGLLAQARRQAITAEFNLEQTETSRSVNHLILGPSGQTLPQLVTLLSSHLSSK